MFSLPAAAVTQLTKDALIVAEKRHVGRACDRHLKRPSVLESGINCSYGEPRR